jgi:hypothetical protein
MTTILLSIIAPGTHAEVPFDLEFLKYCDLFGCWV